MVTSPKAPEDEIGARIRAARAARRMTLTQLSRETDISLSTLSRLESGQRQATVKLLLPIARSLAGFAQIRSRIDKVRSISYVVRSDIFGFRGERFNAFTVDIC